MKAGFKQAGFKQKAGFKQLFLVTGILLSKNAGFRQHLKKADIGFHTASETLFSFKKNIKHSITKTK